MRGAKWLGCLLAVGLLAGCSNKNEANAENFGKALSAYLDRHGQQCLGLRTWPVSLPTDQKSWSPGAPSQRQLLDEFVQHGLASVNERAMGQGLAARLRVRDYNLTAQGMQLRTRLPKPGQLGEPAEDFCWAHRRLDKVVKWDAPMTLGSYQGTSVTYTARLEVNPQWPKALLEGAAVRAYTEQIAGVVAKPKQHGVKLTSEGWEANGMD